MTDKLKLFSSALWDDYDRLLVFCDTIITVAEEDSQLYNFACHVRGEIEEMSVNLSNFSCDIND